MLEFTLVRTKETKEPVAAFSRIDDFIRLGIMIDEITDPSMCEYKDVDIECVLSIAFFEHFDFANLNKYEKEDAIHENSRLFYDSYCSNNLASELSKAFSKKSGWTQIPDNFNFLSSTDDINERFMDFSEEPF